MNIGQALVLLRAGEFVRRSGWNGKGAWIGLQRPSAELHPHEMTVPFVYMHTSQGESVPWLCSQTDLLAEDWERLP